VIIMHMADALISPAVGGVMWAATVGLAAYSARKVQRELDEEKVPLMAVLGAFVFAVQMINFSIPGTGSSGHLGGGILLATLLGPSAAFLTILSILAVQAFFFADGGLLAFGCNAVNLGFFNCFIAYPLFFKPLLKQPLSNGRIWAGAVLASVIGMQLAAFGVVLETTASGISDLPFDKFVLLMQPIHLAIGIIEGLVTAGVLAFVWKARPELAAGVQTTKPLLRPLLIGFAIAAALTAGILTWFGSTHPDGLEWSISGVTGKPEITASPTPAHEAAARIQQKTVILPDYQLKKTTPSVTPPEGKTNWPAVDPGTSLAGLLGGGLTLVLASLVGYGLRWAKRRKKL
jgi:cobalt/nickel transport system permease protein